MIVQYHPLAASDLNRAVSYYNRQRLGLGDELRVVNEETVRVLVIRHHRRHPRFGLQRR